MKQTIMLVLGFILVLLEKYLHVMPQNVQLYVFMIGILLLGVPHGAADLLVAMQNERTTLKPFSKLRFFSIYLGRLIAFAALLWYLPIVGMLLFVVFAAYHFGETDLYQFKTDTLLGKVLVTSYGLLILSIILLHHFEEVKPILLQFKAAQQNIFLLDWIDMQRYVLMSLSGIFFFTSCFIYLLVNKTTTQEGKGQFLIEFACIVVVLYALPMVIGFTFYFILWHSVLSLANILGYLRKNNTYPIRTIVLQMLTYSLLAIGGIALFGMAGFMFTSSNALLGYIFLGLAVLTAPHMQIMHSMYIKLRQFSNT